MRAPPAFAARKAPAPPPPPEISFGTKFMIGGGTFGGFLLFSHLSTVKEDAEEKVRVQKEAKKLKDKEKEYTDIDSGVGAVGAVGCEFPHCGRKRLGHRLIAAN